MTGCPSLSRPRLVCNCWCQFWSWKRPVTHCATVKSRYVCFKTTTSPPLAMGEEQLETKLIREKSPVHSLRRLAICTARRDPNDMTTECGDLIYSSIFVPGSFLNSDFCYIATPDSATGCTLAGTLPKSLHSFAMRSGKWLSVPRTFRTSAQWDMMQMSAGSGSWGLATQLRWMQRVQFSLHQC